MELLGYTGTVLTISSFLPQAVKTVRTRKTRDLSLPTYIILVLSALVWTIYGIGTDAPPIAVTNATVFLASSVVLSIKIKEEYF